MIEEMTEAKSVPQLLPQFPAIFPFQGIIGMPSYLEKEDIIAATEKVKDAEKKRDLVKRITLWGAIGLFLILALIGKFFPGILFGCLFYGLGFAATWVLKLMVTKAYNQLFELKWDHAVKVTDKFLHLMGGRAYTFYDGTILFYSDKACAFSDVETGQVAGFGKNNIKEVMLEHVHLGSTTVGTAVTKTKGTITASLISDRYASTRSTSKTTMNSSTTDHYEWKLDVITNFIDYPKLSFVFPDGQEGEASAKTIYAVLKPDR